MLTRLTDGTAGVIGAVVTGAVDSSASAYHSVSNAGSATWHGLENMYDSRDQMAGTIASGIQVAIDYPAVFAPHPVDSIESAGAFAASAAHTISDGLVGAGSTTLDAVDGAGSWVANHKLETTAIVGTAAVEAFSIGTATPVLAGIAAIGAAGTVSGIFSLGDHLNEHAADIKVLADPDAPQSQRDQAACADPKRHLPI